MKENILVITIGTRDVQLNVSKLNSDILTWSEDFSQIFLKKESSYVIRTFRNSDFPETLVISQPRLDGEVILLSPEWEKFLCFPIIEDTINFFYRAGNSLQFILIVVTNQAETIPQRRTDTLFFGRIVKRFLENRFKIYSNQPTVEILEIKQDVTNSDILYPFMEKAAPNLFKLNPENIDKVYLLAQGGIDQINQALTLQLIRYFRHRLIQLQKAEHVDVQELIFPRLFLNDLSREQLIKHIADYNFELITPAISNNEEILNIAKFAERRLELDYNDKYRNQYVIEEWHTEDTVEGRLKDLYLSAKMHFRRKVYSVYLWKLFTLSENILHPLINQIFNIDVEGLFNKKIKSDDENPTWILVLKGIPGLYEKLVKDKVYLNNPNRRAFAKTLSYMKKKGLLDPTTSQRFTELQQICKTLDLLNDKRNDIAHYLRPLRHSDIEETLSDGSKIEDLNSALDNYFFLTGSSDFGIYNDIQKKLFRIA